GVIQPGSDGDIVIYDPNGHTSIGVDKTHHMNMDHSAWEGYEIDGHVDTVLSRGKVIIDDNSYLGAKGDGRFIKRGLSQYLI
ncbi:MAG TPA: dihydropyrimidinase, partial [Cryobacterium sp.]|nr:dihydropyrimidinase [Cryobacterium sp.]